MTDFPTPFPSAPATSTTKTFEQQRYDRLMESIDEYIGGTGHEMGVDFLVRDLKKTCLDIGSYHRTVLDNCVTFSDYLP